MFTQTPGRGDIIIEKQYFIINANPGRGDIIIENVES